jgi:hypothetical protein
MLLQHIKPTVFFPAEWEKISSAASHRGFLARFGGNERPTIDIGAFTTCIVAVFNLEYGFECRGTFRTFHVCPFRQTFHVCPFHVRYALEQLTGFRQRMSSVFLVCSALLCPVMITQSISSNQSSVWAQ